MAGYLETYGASEEHHAKRARTLKWTSGIVAAAALIAYILFSTFRNFSEEQRVKAFVDRLKARDFQAAYAMFGCTAQTPCRDYSFPRFLEDFGPASPHADASTARVTDGDTCGTGVVVQVEFKAEPVPLWVDRSTKTIGFSPDPECRKKRWHFREFLRSMFGKS